MIFCSKCGKEYSENAVACPNCGELNVKNSNNQVSSKSNVVAILLCLFFGVIGAHRFYVGKVGTGIVLLILTCTFFGIIISSIWALIDLIMLICQKFTDKDNKVLKP